MPAHCTFGWNHPVDQKVRRNLLTSSIALITLLAATFTQAQGSDWGDVPAVKGLDFSKV